ncbi:matrixin family metalloprotease [Luteitalea sp.]|uniref:matrixin family metalloprotease n=1 Tax=Luteitalea sp. TaxID=2004800 RepID=UPI0025BD9712|nr:matrixin family metalloprotease [Luteitalea sp.]
MSQARRVSVLVAILAVLSAIPTSAYLKFGYRINGQSVVLKWPEGRPVSYVVGTRETTGVSAADFRDTIARAFATWENVPSSSIRFAPAGDTTRPLSDNDGITMLAYANRPELDRTLGATSYTIDIIAGALLEADVFFNAAFPWSAAPGGQAGRFDLESIATHEIGHLIGLGHSALGETEVVGSGRRVLSAGAVMFPIAFSPGNIDGRRLQPDDIAGISDIYPDGTFRQETGSISGRVTRGGLGVFGAHVVAMHLRTGALVGGFTLDDSGTFVLAGIEPGPVVLRVEPLDDGDVASFIEGPRVDVGFAVAFSPRAIFVPRGGNAPDVTIDVVGK